MTKIKEWLNKIKQIENKELIIAVILGVVVLVVALAVNGQNNDNVTSNFDEYNTQLENKLSNVISSMDGCGNATVAITYSAGSEKVYAYEVKTQTVGSTVTETSALVTVKGQPLVIKELSPNILGVVVVAKGADNPVLKMQIVQLVQTLLGVSADKVQVFSHKI